MIRPSALARTEVCGLVPVLAAQYPESSVHSAGGEEVHRQIEAALTSGTMEELLPEAEAAIAWLRGFAAAREIAVAVHIEHFLQLKDPESGELLSEGTADVVIVWPDAVAVVDWKTGRQFDLPHPNENIQIQAYAAAAALKFGRDVATGVTVRFVDGQVVPLRSDPYDLWAVVDRVKAINRIGPEARPGVHCMTCFQRHVCPSWRARAATGLTLLRDWQESENGLNVGIDSAASVELLMAIKATREAADHAESLVKSYVLGGGRVEAENGQVYAPGTVQGRKSGPSVAELEAAGLGHLVREGRPFEQWRWRRER